MEFKKEKAESEVKENRQTHLTTLYYLLQKKSLREGKKTVIDLQLFLETHEKYKEEYGILPGSENASPFKLSAKKDVKTEVKGYRLQNRKGLSKERRPPLSLLKNRNPPPTISTARKL